MHNIKGYTPEEMNQRARNFIGKTIRTTYGTTGIVRDAWAEGGTLWLDVKASNGILFVTTNDYATIVTLGDYSQPDINPGNRGELIEDED